MTIPEFIKAAEKQEFTIPVILRHVNGRNVAYTRTNPEYLKRSLAHSIERGFIPFLFDYKKEEWITCPLLKEVFNG